MTENEMFLIKLADELDQEGNISGADIIDQDFESFLKLLEDGKLDFDFTFSGSREPGPYSSRGRETHLCGV
jgi:hypothetical protein